MDEYQGERTPHTSDASSRTDEVGDAVELVNLINRELDNVDSSLSSEFCIYKVPQHIREINEKAYDPRVISIGPFHHGGEKYKSMETFKMRYLKKVVQRSGVGLEKYIEFLKNRESSVRRCYWEIIEMCSNEFVRMLLLDGCFIIELLLCFSDEKYCDVDHFLLTSTMLWDEISYDLILLENQIPFFILEGLFSLAMTSFEPQPLLNLAMSYFEEFNSQKKLLVGISSIEHFTDMILTFHRPISTRVETEKGYDTITTATQLDEAGVKFKMGSSSCLLDIKFTCDGVLEIPRIVLSDNTESLIRNMMALEVCHHRSDSFMIDYLVFMDGLVDTPKDVDLLIESGILHNCLGDSKQVADLFNNMNINITFSYRNFYFSSLCDKLNDYCKIPKHKWRATLKRDYFSSPWRIASTFAAIVLLVLTFIQAICSVLSIA